MQTNYLDPENFDKFIQAIPRLSKFSEGTRRKISPKQMQLLFYVLYYCALRVSECLSLTKDNFNLERRILTLKRTKTGRKKGKMTADGKQIIEFVEQETSIPHPLILMLSELNNMPQTIFPVSRQTAWDYCKKAGKLADLDIFEKQKKRSIEGTWTHLFRKSYAKMMYNNEAKGALIDVKLRHEHKSRDMADSTFTYIKPDINALIEWEDKHFN